MNTFILGACFQHELHTGPYFMTFAPRLSWKIGPKKLFEKSISKHNGLNKIKAINTWATSLIRYGGGIIARRNNKLKSLDQRTRKLMTMNKELNPKAVCKQEGRWKGLIQVLRAVLGLKKIVLLGI